MLACFPNLTANEFRLEKRKTEMTSELKRRSNPSMGLELYLSTPETMKGKRDLACI